jgi:hypothetical protein
MDGTRRAGGGGADGMTEVAHSRMVDDDARRSGSRSRSRRGGVMFNFETILQFKYSNFEVVHIPTVVWFSFLKIFRK